MDRDYMEGIFTRWEREDRMARSYSPIMLAAAASSLSVGAMFAPVSHYRPGRRMKTKGIPSAVPTSKRAKVKAARKANRNRKAGR